MSRLHLAVVFCIALGMAATAAVATLVDLTNFRAPPFPHAERLVRIWNAEPGVTQHDMLAYRDFADLGSAVTALDAFEGAARARLIWHLPDTAGRRVEGEAVTAGYFDLLGVRPILGRAISADEHARGDAVLLLSYQSWVREFDQDPAVVGRALRVSFQNRDDAALYTVIGVLGPDFAGTTEDDMPDLEFWIPLRNYLFGEAYDARDVRTMVTLGRIAAGATMEQVRAQADAIAATLADEYSAIADSHAFNVERFGDNWRAPFRDAGFAFGAAALLLLGVAVANVAMLLLTRAGERRHEFALRAALGAGRARLARQVFAETLGLAAIGGAIGLLAAAPLLDAFLRLGDVVIPAYLEVSPGVTTLAVSFGVLLIAALSAALLPAWLGARVPAAVALRDGSSRLTGVGPNRWASWFVVAEVALTVVLLVVAALFARAYLQLGATDLGFATDQRLRMGLFINDADVADAELPEFYDRLYAHLRAQPGVRDAALVWPTVPMLAPVTGRLQHPAVEDAGPDGLQVSNYAVHDRYFAALDMTLLAGRAFDALEAERGAGAIVSASLAAELGGPQLALNQQVILNGNPYQVVGVVPDARYNGALESGAHRYEMYLSLRQLPRRLVSSIVHTNGDPAAFAQPLTQAMATIAPTSAVDWIEPVDTFVAWLYRDSAFRLAVVAAFGISALLLAVAGLYAVLSQRVLRETAEIGLRKALGATESRILRRVVARGLGIALAGVALGFALAVAAARLVGGLLHGGSVYDPLAFGAGALVLMGAAAVACVLPARRAARIEPMEALRHE